MDISGNLLMKDRAKDRLMLLERLLVLRAIVLVAGLFIFAVGFLPQSTEITAPTLSSLFIVSAVYSLGAWLWYRSGRLISNRVLAAQLLWDSLVILILVWVSGRSTNPFIYYLLVIIAISASIFSQRILWTFCVGGITAYSLLMYLDFNQHMAHITADFQSHLFGMWLNFVGSAVLISFFISRLTMALRERDKALALAREEILKHEQLIGIGTLAASTMHSIGTPLSTIAMTVSEIDELHQDADTKNYTSLIKLQIDRCKKTMKKLSTLVGQDANATNYVLLQTLVDDIKEHFILTNAQPMPNFSTRFSADNIALPGGLLLKHAVINLIDNAVQAASSLVNVIFECNANILRITIEDNGEGIDADILNELGENIFSSKSSGLGIGVLLANSTIERLQGQVRFTNPSGKDPHSFTQVIVEIPIADASTATLSESVLAEAPAGYPIENKHTVEVKP